MWSIIQVLKDQTTVCIKQLELCQFHPHSLLSRTKLATEVKGGVREFAAFGTKTVILRMQFSSGFCLTEREENNNFTFGFYTEMWTLQVKVVSKDNVEEDIFYLFLSVKY